MPARRQANEQHLGFVLDFAQRDLRQVSDHDWKRQVADDEWEGLAAELSGFFYAAGGLNHLGAEGLPDRFPRSAMLSLQTEVNAILRTIITSREWEIERRRTHPNGYFVSNRIRSIPFQATYDLYQHEGRTWVWVEGTERDLFHPASPLGLEGRGSASNLQMRTPLLESASTDVLHEP